MSNAEQFLAVDLGAESGRVMRGSLAGGRLQIAEAHRFANGPLQQGESLRWDFAKILAGVKRGIALGVEQGGKEIAGISVDSWGVDFGLLDGRGELVENPYHYRDRQTEGMLEEAFRRVPKRELYERTGIEIRRINSLFQLLAMRLRHDPALARARRLMFMADLVAHALCGETFAEYTLASTSQMADMHTGAWSAELLARLDLPADLLPQIVKPGTVVGRLTAAAAAECGCGRVPVIAAGSHDTACAVAAVPAEGDDWAYLSSGTWSLAGVELKEAVITDASFEHNITNEGGVEGTIRFLTSLGRAVAGAGVPAAVAARGKRFLVRAVDGDGAPGAAVRGADRAGRRRVSARPATCRRGSTAISSRRPAAAVERGVGPAGGRCRTRARSSAAFSRRWLSRIGGRSTRSRR